MKARRPYWDVRVGWTPESNSVPHWGVVYGALPHGDLVPLRAFVEAHGFVADKCVRRKILTMCLQKPDRRGFILRQGRRPISRRAITLLMTRSALPWEEVNELLALLTPGLPDSIVCRKDRLPPAKLAPIQQLARSGADLRMAKFLAARGAHQHGRLGPAIDDAMEEFLVSETELRKVWKRWREPLRKRQRALDWLGQQQSAQHEF